MPHHLCPPHLRDVGEVLVGEVCRVLEENLHLWAHLLGMGVSKEWEEGWETGEDEGTWGTTWRALACSDRGR